MDQFEYKGLDFHYHKSALREPVNLAIFKELGYQGTHFYIYLMGEINQKKGYYFSYTQANISDFLRFEMSEVDRRKPKVLEILVNILLKERIFDQDMLEEHGILTSMKLQKNFFRATKRRKYTGTEPFPYLYPETVDYIRKIHKIKEEEDAKTDESAAAMYDELAEILTQDDRVSNPIITPTTHDANTHCTSVVQDGDKNVTEKKQDLYTNVYKNVHENFTQTTESQILNPKTENTNVVHDVVIDVLHHTIYDRVRVKEKVKEKELFLNALHFHFSFNTTIQENFWFDFFDRVTEKDLNAENEKGVHPCRELFLKMHSEIFKVPYLSDKEGNTAVKRILIYIEKSLELHQINENKNVRVLLVWQYVLLNWDKLTPSMQKKHDFLNIERNINEIFARLEVFQKDKEVADAPKLVIKDPHKFYPLWSEKFSENCVPESKYDLDFAKINAYIESFLNKNGFENENMALKSQEIFVFILKNWSKLNKFKRKQIFPSQIHHYLPEIFVDLGVKNVDLIINDTQKDTNFKSYMDAYYNFYKSRMNGIPPNINAVEGKELKKIMVYFKLISNGKTPDATEEEKNAKAFEMWHFVLENWDKQTQFYQNQLKISQINYNLTNILNQLRNGKSTTKSINDARTSELEEYANQLAVELGGGNAAAF